jgi:phage terminase small subunit
MRILRPKWERFAQELARGKTSGQAYEIAGFSPNPANAWRLHKREEIRRRIDEILTREERAVDKAMANAAARVGLNEEWVLRNLRMNAVMAMRAGDRAAANRAIELIGKHLGLFIDKKQIEINHIDDADEYLANILALVDAKTVDHEPPLLQLEEDGNKYGPGHRAGHRSRRPRFGTTGPRIPRHR